MFELGLSDLLNLNPDIMNVIDGAFLIFFFCEICLKIFASQGMYFFDFFNCFDGAIVFISFILNILEIVAKGLVVLRLIRVVVITIRKITGN